MRRRGGPAQALLWAWPRFGYRTVVNASWHRAHVLPRNATPVQRLAWHRAHQQACACRPVPASLRAKLAGKAPVAAEMDPRVAKLVQAFARDREVSYGGKGFGSGALKVFNEGYSATGGEARRPDRGAGRCRASSSGRRRRWASDDSASSRSDSCSSAGRPRSLLRRRVLSMPLLRPTKISEDHHLLALLQRGGCRGRHQASEGRVDRSGFIGRFSTRTKNEPCTHCPP